MLPNLCYNAALQHPLRPLPAQLQPAYLSPEVPTYLHAATSPDPHQLEPHAQVTVLLTLKAETYVKAAFAVGGSSTKA